MHGCIFRWVYMLCYFNFHCMLDYIMLRTRRRVSRIWAKRSMLGDCVYVIWLHRTTRHWLKEKDEAYLCWWLKWKYSLFGAVFKKLSLLCGHVGDSISINIFTFLKLWLNIRTFIWILLSINWLMIFNLSWKIW